MLFGCRGACDAFGACAAPLSLPVVLHVARRRAERIPMIPKGYQSYSNTTPIGGQQDCSRPQPFGALFLRSSSSCYSLSLHPCPNAVWVAIASRPAKPQPFYFIICTLRAVPARPELCTAWLRHRTKNSSHSCVLFHSGSPALILRLRKFGMALVSAPASHVRRYNLSV